MNVKELTAAGLWTASIVAVLGFTWEAFKQTYNEFPVGGGNYLNQTGPGQRNDPAKVPATPPTGKSATKREKAVAGYRGPDGKPLQFPPNSLLNQPNEQLFINWLTAHGWNREQIGQYLRALYLQVPKGY